LVRRNDPSSGGNEYKGKPVGPEEKWVKSHREENKFLLRKHWGAAPRRKNSQIGLLNTQGRKKKKESGVVLINEKRD